MGVALFAFWLLTLVGLLWPPPRLSPHKPLSGPVMVALFAGLPTYTHECIYESLTVNKSCPHLCVVFKSLL